MFYFSGCNLKLYYFIDIFLSTSTRGDPFDPDRIGWIDAKMKKPKQFNDFQSKNQDKSRFKNIDFIDAILHIPPRK